MHNRVLYIQRQLLVIHILHTFHVALYYAFAADLLPYALHFLPLSSHPAWVVHTQAVLALDHYALYFEVVCLLNFVFKHVDHGLGPLNAQVHVCDLFECLKQALLPLILLLHPVRVLERRVRDVLQHVVLVIEGQ